MALSLAACGGKANDSQKNDSGAEVTLTAQQIMDALKAQLGDSFDCDVDRGMRTRMSGYWGFDMSRALRDWAAMSNSNSSLNPSTAVVRQGQGRLCPGRRRAFAVRLRAGAQLRPDVQHGFADGLCRRSCSSAEIMSPC